MQGEDDRGKEKQKGRGRKSRQDRHNIHSTKCQMDKEIVFPKDDKTPELRDPVLNVKNKNL